MIKLSIKGCFTMDNEIISDNKRQFFRIKFEKPVCAEMTISMIHGKIMKIGYSNICVKDKGPGGLAFDSFLELPVDEGVLYNFRIILYNEEVRLRGKIVRTVALEHNAHEYGVRFEFLQTEESKFMLLFNKLNMSMRGSSMKGVCNFCEQEVYPCCR
jgi:hypothetical protein